MTSLSPTQRNALQTFKGVLALHQDGIRMANPGAIPSEWVSHFTLTQIHSVGIASLKALVKKGYLEQQASDGSGSQYKLAAGVTTYDPTKF